MDRGMDGDDYISKNESPPAPLSAIASAGRTNFSRLSSQRYSVSKRSQKELNNIGCTYRGDFQTDVLASYPAVCDST